MLRFPTHWVPSKIVASLAGVDRTGNIRVLNTPIGISDELDETPNTATFRCTGFTPTVGQGVVIGAGLLMFREFAGHILTAKQVYEGLPSNVAFDITCQDYTWELNQKLVNKKYAASVSATTAIVDLLEEYAPSFSTDDVAADLPEIGGDGIELTDEPLLNAIARIMHRVGGYCKPTYTRSVAAFLEDTDGSPADITDANKPIDQLASTVEIGQMRTRVLCEGGGGTSPIKVVAGSTKIPVENPDWYAASGQVKAGPQRVTYTGVVTGGDGALIGTVANPSNAVNVAHLSGSGVTSGVHSYVQTWVTAGGETLPSPVSAEITAGGQITKPPAPSPAKQAGGNLSAGAYDWKLSYYDSAGGETEASLQSATALFESSGKAIVTIGVSSDPLVVGRKLYRTEVDGTDFKLVATIANNSSTFYLDNVADGDLGVAAPSTNTTVKGQVAVTGIAIGPTGTTGRKVYRTAAGGSVYKLLATIGNNTTTAYNDSTADGSLGVDAPVTDTAGLVADLETVINQGASDVPVASIGPFQSGGGWARIGSLVISYTGFTGTSLTGVPPLGELGALTSSVRYGTEILAVPMLTGIASSGAGSIAYDIPQGTTVNCLAQADDEDAQAWLALQLDPDEEDPNIDGVVEHVIKDARLTAASASKRAYADLAQFKDPIVTLEFDVRGDAYVTGKSFGVDIGAPTSVSGTFKILSVRLSQIAQIPGTLPLRHVVASSVRFSFEDVMRRLQLAS